MHQIGQSPFDANKLYSSNDGGVWLSTDGGNNWTPKSNGLYAYEVGINTGKSSHTNRDYTIIGTQDNGKLYRDAAGWFCVKGGDDYQKKEYDYLPNGGYLYDLTDFTRELAPVGNSAPFGLPGTGDINAVAFNRTNPEAGYIARGQIYRTANLSATTPAWSQISTLSGTVMAMHSCIADVNRLYVITDDGKIHVSTNATSGTPTFTIFSLPSSSGTLASIAAIANNANTVYISIDDKVYVSVNSGASWTDITYNLPAVNHRRILAEEYGGTQELVFVATNNAVYYKKVGQTSWTNYSTNLPGRRGPTDFSMYDNGTNQSLIRYTSFGRGMWETSFSNLRVAQAAFNASTTTPCPNASVQFTDGTIGFTPTSWSWSFPGGNPATSNLQNPVVTYAAAGASYNVTLTASDGVNTSTVTVNNYINTLPAITLPYSEGFEGTFPPTGLSLSTNTNYNFEQSTTVGGYGTSSKSASFINFEQAHNNTTANIITNSIVLAPIATAATFSFDVAYSRYFFDDDTLTVSVSTDCGATYTELYRKNGTQLSTNGGIDNFGSSFVPTPSQWRTDNIDISAYNGQTVKFKIKHIVLSGNNLYLDNLNINQANPSYIITASAGSNGTITPSGPVSVASGANQTFAIAANSGYTIQDVLVDGVSQGAIGTYTFTNVTAVHTISASFVAVVLPNLTVNDITLNEGNSGTTSFTFTVGLSSPAPAGGVSFDIATANSTAIAPGDYTAKSLTAQTIPAGSSTYSFTVLVNGDATFESTESFLVNITNATNANVTDAQGIGTITNDDAAPLPNLSIDDVTLNEGNSGTTSFTFTVGLSIPAPTGGVTFDIATANSTAIAPGDYTAKSLTAQTIPAGSSTYSFTVLVNGDATFESTESFFVNITNATNANVTDAQGIGTITNDDAAPLPNLSIDDVTLNEGNSGTTSFTFTVGLSIPAPTGGVTFDIATANSTAIAPGDYTAKSLTAQTIPAGSSTYSFTVLVNGDATFETTESFLVNITNATNANVTDAQGVGTITNDDAAPLPNLTIDDVTLNEGNSGTTSFTFTVGLSFPAPTGGVSFDIATANSTAIAPGDYTAKSLTAQTIPAGSSTYSFTVLVNGDATFETTESFFVNITNATNANVTDAQGVGTITNDDVAPFITYYPRNTATDLSQVSNWTDAPSGTGGSSPANFTSPNQLFNVNNNVAKPTVLGAWAISGGSSLVLNNTDSLIFRPAASITIGTGSTADFNGKSVTLKSTSTGTAFIGTITGSLLNATNVTVERYLSSNNNRAYRILAPSVNTATTIRTNWQENGSSVSGLGTHITGSTTGANGFDITQTGEGSLFTYNQVTPAWEYINNTNVNALDAKKGHLIFIRGDRTIDLNSTASPLPSNNATLRATGTLLTSTQSFTGLTGNSNFSLVTNPYAAAINWASVHGASTGAANAYTLWDPNVGTRGGYVTVNTSGIKSNAGSNATTSIQSGQAFFVQASGVPAPVINILETHKSITNNIDVFRLGAQTELFTSSLFYNDAFNNRINADGVTSVYNNNYDTAIDENDATQIANWDEDISIARSNALSIESRPLIDLVDTIPFTMARMQQHGYEWQFNATGFMHPNLSASLVDNYLGTKTPVSLVGTTIVPFNVTGNTASSAANRFMMVFGPNTALPVSMVSVKAYQIGRDIQVEWTAQTETNLDKYEVEESNDARQFTKAGSVTARGSSTVTTYDWLDVNVNNGSNYYRIKAISKNGEVQYSKVVRVNMGKTGNEIFVYPNPIKNNAFSLSVNLPIGTYTVRVTNKLGQQVYKKQIVHLGGVATQTLQLRAGLSQGVYQLTVSDGENKYVQQLVK